MEEYGPGEEALRAAAAAAASWEGNPEKLRGVQGTKPPPTPVSTSSSNTFPSLPPFLQASRRRLYLQLFCHWSQETSEPSVPSNVQSLLWTSPRPRLYSLYPSCLPLLPPEVSASSFSLHLLRPSRTLDFLCSSLVFLLNVCEHYSGELQTAKWTIGVYN